MDDDTDNLTIGIVGGMGPLAGIDFQMKLTTLTPATKDQDHFKVIHISDPSIGDRTYDMESGVDTFVSQIVNVIKKIEYHDPDYIVIACNTAHARLPEIQAHTNVPILSLIDMTAQFVKDSNPKIISVGLLSTRGTVISMIYHKAFESHGINVITPKEETIDQCVMKSIYEIIKSNNDLSEARTLLNRAIGELIANGAQKVILGCTEIPLVYEMNDILIDPATVVAQHLVSLKQKTP